MKKTKRRYILEQDTMFDPDPKDPQQVERYKKMAAKKRSAGISEDETWDLVTSLARFMEPRLKQFNRQNIGTPASYDGDLDGWRKSIDKMIYMFKHLADDDWPNYGEDAKFDEGAELFSKYWMDLWW